MKKSKGQILVGAILLLVVLAILIPAMVNYVKHETGQSEKERQNNNAFQLAEAAVDRGYQKIAESTTTWNRLMRGTIPAGFNFDTSYTELPGGAYTISICSGPSTQQTTITGIGRDKRNKEIRALKVVFTNAIMADTSIASASGVTMNGNNIEVEWGAVSSPRAVSILTKLHPSFYSASSIDKDTNGSQIPNDDPYKWWWHSYYTALPPMPSIDFQSYIDSATADGKYYAGDYNFTANDTTGRTYYIGGNTAGFASAISGNIIVRGNFDFSNGKQATIGAYDAVVPTQAWKQYCNDWAYYRANFDPTPPASPACFGNINNGYRAYGKTFSISPAIKGLLYVGGNLTLPNGGGSSALLHGVIIVNGNADISSNSNCKIYYDPNAAATIRTTRVYLVRSSWVNSSSTWPSGLP